MSLGSLGGCPGLLLGPCPHWGRPWCEEGDAGAEGTRLWPRLQEGCGRTCFGAADGGESGRQEKASWDEEGQLQPQPH